MQDWIKKHLPTRRQWADLLALVTALAVLVIGAVTVLGDGDVLAPTSTSTVTKKAVPKGPATNKTTTVTTTPGKSGSKQSVTTKTVETTPDTPSKPQEVTVTKQEGERSLAERLLGSGGTLVLQLAVLVLAAFVAGAAVQRVIMGQYALKFGEFELSALADNSAAGIDGVNQKVDALAQATTSELDQLDKSHRDEAATLREDLALAYKRLAFVEDRVDGMETKVGE